MTESLVVTITRTNGTTPLDPILADLLVAVSEAHQKQLLRDAGVYPSPNVTVKAEFIRS